MSAGPQPGVTGNVTVMALCVACGSQALSPLSQSNYGGPERPLGDALPACGGCGSKAPAAIVTSVVPVL
jgi:hypothetical protein